MDGTRKFVEAMGKDGSDKLLKGIGASEVKKTLNHIVKQSNRSLYFELIQMKGRASNDKKWSMSSFEDGVVGKRGQYVVCGKAKWNNSKHLTLVKRLVKLGEKEEQIKLYRESEAKGGCDHAMGIVSEGKGGECRLYDNTWNVDYKLYSVSNFVSSLASAKCCFFFNLIEL